MFVIWSEPLCANVFKMFTFHMMNLCYKGIKIKETDYFTFGTTNLGFLEKLDLILECLESFGRTGISDKLCAWWHNSCQYGTYHMIGTDVFWCQ